MAKILRKTQRIFSSNSPMTTVGVFGSKLAGTPTYTADPDLIQNAAYLQGWDLALRNQNSLVKEDLAAIQYLYSYQLAYLMQQGIPEWNGTTTYYIGSVCSSQNQLWQSLTDDNINNLPVAGTNWVAITQVLGINEIAVGTGKTNTQTLGDVIASVSGGLQIKAGIIPSALSALSDVNITSPMNNQVLTFNSTTGMWENKASQGGGGTGGKDNFYELGDVAITTPANGDIVRYNTTTFKWENTPLPTPPTPSLALTDLTNVTITSPVNDQVLTYENGAWINKEVSSGGGTATLSGLTDVAIASLTDKQILTWDLATNKWINADAPSGGGGDSVIKPYNASTFYKVGDWVNLPRLSDTVDEGVYYTRHAGTPNAFYFSNNPRNDEYFDGMGKPSPLSWIKDWTVFPFLTKDFMNQDSSGAILIGYWNSTQGTGRQYRTWVITNQWGNDNAQYAGASSTVLDQINFGVIQGGCSLNDTVLIWTTDGYSYNTQSNQVGYGTWQSKITFASKSVDSAVNTIVADRFNNRFVMFGSQGNIYTSPDAITWTLTGTYDGASNNAYVMSNSTSSEAGSFFIMTNQTPYTAYIRPNTVPLDATTVQRNFTLDGETSATNGRVIVSIYDNSTEWIIIYTQNQSKYVAVSTDGGFVFNTYYRIPYYCDTANIYNARKTSAFRMTGMSNDKFSIDHVYAEPIPKEMGGGGGNSIFSLTSERTGYVSTIKEPANAGNFAHRFVSKKSPLSRDPNLDNYFDQNLPAPNNKFQSGALTYMVAGNQSESTKPSRFVFDKLPMFLLKDVEVQAPMLDGDVFTFNANRRAFVNKNPSNSYVGDSPSGQSQMSTPYYTWIIGNTSNPSYQSSIKYQYLTRQMTPTDSYQWGISVPYSGHPMADSIKAGDFWEFRMTPQNNTTIAGTKGWLVGQQVVGSPYFTPKENLLFPWETIRLTALKNNPAVWETDWLFQKFGIREGTFVPSLAGTISGTPNYTVRKGHWKVEGNILDIKIIINGTATSSSASAAMFTTDTLWDSFPLELQNYLNANSINANFVGQMIVMGGGQIMGSAYISGGLTSIKGNANILNASGTAVNYTTAANGNFGIHCDARIYLK